MAWLGAAALEGLRLHSSAAKRPSALPAVCRKTSFHGFGDSASTAHAATSVPPVALFSVTRLGAAQCVSPVPVTTSLRPPAVEVELVAAVPAREAATAVPSRSRTLMPVMSGRTLSFLSSAEPGTELRA